MPGGWGRLAGVHSSCNLIMAGIFLLGVEAGEPENMSRGKQERGQKAKHSGVVGVITPFCSDCYRIL